MSAIKWQRLIPVSKIAAAFHNRIILWHKKLLIRVSMNPSFIYKKYNILNQYNMETLEHVLNTFVDSFYQQPPKRNPSNYRDFVHYYQEEKSMDDLIEHYPLLTKLNEQYHFIRSDELYLHLEYNILKEMIPDLPNELLSGEEYDQIIYEYERIPDHKKQRRRFERTVRFICRIFQSFSTGVQEFNSRFVQCPIALCVGI
jgi:hypothetical protein